MPCQLSGAARSVVRTCRGWVAGPLLPALLALLTFVALPRAVAAQAATAVDSALVRRILVAEDRRDTLAPALRDGVASADPRVQLLARRARARAADPKFAARDSLPALAAPPAYPDPAWRLRFRALTVKPVDCGKLTLALADSAWPVRLRAMDLASLECAGAADLVAAMRRMAANPPANGRRSRGSPGWQASAHALVALARLAPSDARTALPRFTASPVAWLRVYAAHAAAVLSDTATLRRLAADRDDNVKEAAIDGLAKTAGHAADDVYLGAIMSSGYQAIRAAGNALKGTTRTADLKYPAETALRRLRAGDSETARDARNALADRLKEAGVADATGALERQPAPVDLPRDAVALALGREYRVRVTLADSSGGGSFVVKLRGDAAPIMAARVLDLVRSGWYNGRTWYRVEPDFVIQGGGPGSNEYVGHPRFMRDELSTLPHVRGTVGMSTRGHDTGDAQWFINLRDNQRLTRDYTGFGEIVEGIDVVDGILEGDVIKRMEILPAKPHD